MIPRIMLSTFQSSHPKIHEEIGSCAGNGCLPLTPYEAEKATKVGSANYFFGFPRPVPFYWRDEE